MSVVVLRDGIIAADTLGSIDNVQLKAHKIRRQGDVAIGHAGHWVDGERFADWYFAGADMDKLPDFHHEGTDAINFAAIVLHPDGWEYWDQLFYRDTDLQCNPYMAIGTGAEAARGALYLGATAIEAVEAACALEQHCGLPVQHESIEQTVGDLDINELGRILHELEGAQPLGLVE